MKARVKKDITKTVGIWQLSVRIFTLCDQYVEMEQKRRRFFLYFLNMIPDKGIILDIGANIGIMSVWLGRYRPKAKIISFEPIPHNIKALKKV